jgi:uncharacterized protein DUF2523
MFSFFSQLYSDFQAWFTGIWADFIEFVEYIPIKLLDLLLSAFASLLEAIPVPDFVINNGLQSAINGLSPDILYFLSQSGMDSALLILSSGFAFRFLRKVVTLFQW